MGLDMYMNRRRYIWYDERENLKITGLKTPVDGAKVKFLVEEVGYWRKANAIHKWFVDNVQDGVDDCGEYSVSREQLLELLGTVNKVLASCELVKGKVYAGTTYKDGKSQEIYEDGSVIKDSTVAEELLPTGSGFFFGGTDYDEWYLKELESTRDIINEALKDSEDITYQSSW
jgi:hypothetical protein